MPRLVSPYGKVADGWLRGNLHTHTMASDGYLPPWEMVTEYARLGYDFLMLSDHDTLTPVAGLDARGMVLIPGHEVTAEGGHMLHVNASRVVPALKNRQRVIDRINADGGMAVLCHPNWEASFNHWPQKDLERLTGYAGIEIFNGIAVRHPGNADATDRWDQLLGKGRRVWGFGNDDTHKPVDQAMAWNMVHAKDRSVEGIVDALRSGRFYVSTGVYIDAIRVSGRHIRVEARNAQCYDLIADFGRVVARVADSNLDFEVPREFWGRFTYIRMVCHGPAAIQAWTQPFFLEK
ncbi:MAG TPA: CehA/McbA family metallohydrolase [Candidatus Hydrogenedentes bacterium]|nr:CehA/McbA family metallohydrolase [Candidatus Hydrogenedentota bacterium]